MGKKGGGSGGWFSSVKKVFKQSTNKDLPEKKFQCGSMSMESANPDLYKLIRDATEEDEEIWSGSVNLHRLYPDQFKGACSCFDCDKKLKRLRGFEINIIFLGQLNGRHLTKVQYEEHVGDYLSYMASATKRIFDMLHKNIKIVCEKGRLSFTPPTSPSKYELFDQHITQLLVTSKLNETPMKRSSPSGPSKDALSSEIRRLMYWYESLKVDKEAEPLLKQILEIEQENNFEIQKTTPDYSILKQNIERQIEKLELMNLEVLEQELKEIIELVCPRTDHYRMFEKVRQYISDVDAAVHMKKDNFWKNYNYVKGHSANGLDKILDFLIEKVNLFDKEWEKVFAPFFTNPINRRDPKRQRTL